MSATPDAVVSTESAARLAQVSSPTETQLPPPAPPAIPSSSLPQTLAQTQVDRAQTNVSVTAPAPVPAPSQAQEGKAMMRIDFNAECWVSLQTVDGKKQDRIYKSGESLSVPLANVSALVLGNAPAAKVTLAGRQVDVMTRGITQGNVTRLDQKGIQLLQKN
jgi:cytoskeletal protein RodZ